MLNVKTPDEVIEIINTSFHTIAKIENVELSNALGRVLAKDILSREFVPSFNRSSVDGYAVFAKDTFGCSESIPAILKLSSSVKMGENITNSLDNYSCVYVPTGAKVLDGADAVVMIEYCEKISSDEISIFKPVAPGENLVFKGDDIKENEIVVKKGTTILPQHIGALSSLGISSLDVYKKPIAGIISTGDELVSINDIPKEGQVRDVNSYLVSALLKSFGADTITYGFIKDDENALRSTINKAISECDLVIISGGSSVGEKDATARILEEFSPLLFHGIAMKPGKPTILANYMNKPLLGLPGHPAASFFVSQLFLKPLLYKLLGKEEKDYECYAILDESISANQGRAVYIGVSLRKEKDLHAFPIQSKSGLLTSLLKSDGYVCVPRDCEGFSKGTLVKVHLF